jgi:Fe-S-cluster containining protein
MKPEYAALVEGAVKKEKQIVQFFTFLKNRQPKDIDVQVKLFHDEAFEQIDCLECGNCCKTLGPMITQKDVEEAAKALKMKPSAFMETYLKTDEDNDLVFKEMPCPLLMADNHCSIYGRHPKACREYPHTDKPKFLNRRYITMKNAETCPAVAKIVDLLMEHYRFR